ncbi:MAG TPA: hypothetical protein RMH99_10120, partial [Sandaracinaceae bacterium LLY-WYZ-13_1]|nr:hypothetical protein [Sandaracinaceae bacterium LLY-WYZ-13_1]
MHRLAWIGAVALVVLAAGCARRARVRATYSYDNRTAPAQVTVQAQPPPPRAVVDVRPPQPGPGFVWIAGHWGWNGSWVWRRGRWIEQRPGYVWTPPVARRVGGRIVYHRGYWRRRGRRPARVYRSRGRVRVRARPARGRGRPARVRGRRGRVQRRGGSVQVRRRGRG